ncbi:outer membrane lipoprotein Blc [Candidatus Protochlamydia naegleriophila]|uniref:Outer membrane lipoprotein Blc n=1 Tax=Candidatus Protochlamydia naegleriophila TaxID=389348 RepID=A0A0U5ERF9_9BACT|nr:lipocalin family protein [Candidatus Protochlamydia naegleriophila]CUI16721.1 outer membrane lipoprotein Blc [Candidatus Protochlamydia naegleriophila]
MRTRFFPSLLSFFCLFGQASEAMDFPEFQTVSHVDLNRYMGTWYEIARLDEPWDRGCYHNPIAIFTMKNDGTIHVLNQCETDNFFNSTQKAEGVAEVVDKQSNAKLKLIFPRSEHYKGLPIGDYWIIQLADDYSYAAVSDPAQKHLWILSRTPSLPQDVYQSILDKVVLMMPNLNVLNVLRTQQDPLDAQKGAKK